MTLYQLHRNMETGDLTGGWIGTNEHGMDSDDGVFEFVFVPVVLDPVTRWCFAHQEEVFTEVGTDKLICAQHLRSPCDIDDAAVIRIEGET